MTETITTPLPIFPPRSVENRMRHFDSSVYQKDSSTLLFKLVDALTGDGGAADLKKNVLMQRLAHQADTMYFRDLDRLFETAIGLARLPEESYPWNPEQDMLTKEEWDEVLVKDSWFRERARDYLVALGLGGTPEGFRMAVHAVLGVDADLFEIWRFIDQLGFNEHIVDSFSRAHGTFRNEVVIRPHTDEVSEKDVHHIYKILEQIKPVDTIVTVDIQGLAVNTEVPMRSVAADSSYFEVQREVTGIPDLMKISRADFMMEDVIQSELWLQPGQKSLAPNTAFNSTQEHSIYYVYSLKDANSIGSVSYSTVSGSTRTPQPDFQVWEQTPTAWSAWSTFDKADSPDNYPGGKYGQTPDAEPALDKYGEPYEFEFESQEEYIADFVKNSTREIDVSGNRYRFGTSYIKRVVERFEAIGAVARKPPSRESQYSTNWIASMNGEVGRTTAYD